jgi:septal ring factor EnvC (AmiA/AmiB activator)
VGALATSAAAENLVLRQAEAKQQQAELRQRIAVLQKAIQAREGMRKQAVDALKQSESAISLLNRRLHELAQDSRKAQADWYALQQQITVQQAVLDKQREILAAQLRSQYQSRLSPWTTLLSGDDPALLGRNLSYLAYLARARAGDVQRLRLEIDRMGVLQAQAEARAREIAQGATATAQQKAMLVQQIKVRASVLAQLQGKIAEQHAQASKLEQDERHLTRLIQELDGVLSKQAEQENRRLAQARSRAEAAHRVRQAHAPEASLVISGAKALRSAWPIPMSVRGQIQGRFGAKRPDGGVWRGVVLRAAQGTPVQAAASGTVVYADWLRGFGNLIIVDHGQQYLTVYAYNQSLLKGVGDFVTLGDTIATVGASGGQVESGLYFEIRHRGVPVDPVQWLAQ